MRKLLMLCVKTSSFYRSTSRRQLTDHRLLQVHSGFRWLTYVLAPIDFVPYARILSRRCGPAVCCHRSGRHVGSYLCRARERESHRSSARCARRCLDSQYSVASRQSPLFHRIPTIRHMIESYNEIRTKVKAQMAEGVIRIIQVQSGPDRSSCQCQRLIH